MRNLLLVVVAVLVTFAIFFPDRALAQSSDPAAAEALFQKGRGAMEREDFDAACQMFEESFSLDPAVGTVMNLAVCEEKRGRLARSWERWHQALDLLDEDDERVSYAVIQMEAVEGRLAYLTIVAQMGAPPGLVFRRDDVVLGGASFGQELPMDPGKHVITVESPGHEPKRYTVALELGERKELAVTAGPPSDADGAGADPNPRKTIGVAALGVGAVGLGLAITTGVLLPRQHEKVEQGCPAKSCSEEGLQAVSGAKTLLALNTAGWIATGVGAAAGITLLLILPKNEKSPPPASTSARTVGVALLGTGVNVFGAF